MRNGKGKRRARPCLPESGGKPPHSKLEGLPRNLRGVVLKLERFT